MKNPIDRRGHVAKAVLTDFTAGLLTHDELMKATEHIAGCKQCALALAQAIETKQAALVPVGFDEEVLCRIRRLKEKKTEFLRFSFRVALAACVALFLIFSNTLNTLAGSDNYLKKIESFDFSVVESINTHLHCFSQRLLYMEVFQHDEETK